MNQRLNREALNIQIASLLAARGTCERLQVGAIIVKDKRIICTGYNGPLPKMPHCSGKVCDISQPCERAIHAEQNVIGYAARVGIKLEGTTMYCTHQPCLKCAELIIISGILEVYFLHSYRLDDGLKLLHKNLIKIHQIDAQGNLYTQGQEIPIEI